MNSDDIRLFSIDFIILKIKNWILEIKEKYQIYDYNYSVDLEVGNINDKKIILKIESKYPKPTLIYKIVIEDIEETNYCDNDVLKDFLKDITRNTRVI